MPESVRITGEPKGHQNMTVIEFGELIFFLGLVGLAVPTESRCYSKSMANQNHNSSPVTKWVRGIWLTSP
jgi:hypothetical protein